MRIYLINRSSALALAAILALVFGLGLACGRDKITNESTSTATATKVSVTLDNQSQFAVEKLMLHDAVGNYDVNANILTKPLGIGEQWRTEVEARGWYVTILRKPNTDAEPLAYTTARAWYPANHPRLIYYDEQFRGAARDDSRPAAND